MEGRDEHLKYLLSLPSPSSSSPISSQPSTSSSDCPYGDLSAIRLCVVGAGGIGCELLKCLVCSGFVDITVVDLDTIDVSNLNRQFLFRKIHVGMPKAIVAAEAVKAFNPAADVKGFRGNVRDPEFGAEFMRSFSVVLNALDNQDARTHVNRICISNDIPLLESGSMGYNGQTFCIQSGLTQCYECYGRVRQKTFAVCTIRSTPDKPEHCVAWAKYLFELLFGPDDCSNVLSDLKEHIHGDLNETGRSIGSTDGRAQQEFARRAFEYLFNSEISKAAALPDAWTHRQPPRSLTIDDAMSQSVVEGTAAMIGVVTVKEQELWSLRVCASKFCESVCTVFRERAPDVGSLVFDKDDVIAMDFVAAASNLRMHNFRIPLKSRWDLQSIAGSIVPAIATTNAMVAAMQVVQLFHLLEHRERKKLPQPTAADGAEPATSARTTPDTNDLVENSKLKYVTVRKVPTSSGASDIISAISLELPNKQCFVCQQQQVAVTLHSFREWTLLGLINKVVKEGLRANQPLLDFEGRCLWDPDDEEEDSMPMSKKTLEELGVHNDSYMIVTDTSQGNFQCDIILSEDPKLDANNNIDLYTMETKIMGRATNEDGSTTTNTEESEDDDIQSSTNFVEKINEADDESDDGVIAVDAGGTEMKEDVDDGHVPEKATTAHQEPVVVPKRGTKRKVDVTRPSDNIPDDENEEGTCPTKKARERSIDLEIE
eukprot:GHVS01014732.1.p1 GENE.GHVS01014732.1~~GHVS01014732.1.p1  ORF type:complete len:712 (-),score=120.41 GHVS01014732.1:288-2423(-)